MWRNEMIRIVSILFTLVSYAVSDDCVRYTFEDNLSEWYGNGAINSGFCTGNPVWVVGNYSSLNLTGPNERSTSFISPSVYFPFSCAQSFNFSMNQGGTLEVKIFCEKNLGNNLIIYASTISGHIIARYDLPSYVDGWATARMTLNGSGTFVGHVEIYGGASPGSIVLVDSFRYIPPGMNEEECQLYSSNETTTPNSTTSEPTTKEPTTPDSTTSEPTTKEPTTPDSTTSEPTTKEPTTPDSTTSEPTTREPTTPETTSVEPTAPDPSESKTITFMMKMKMIFKL